MKVALWIVLVGGAAAGGWVARGSRTVPETATATAPARSAERPVICRGATVDEIRALLAETRAPPSPPPGPPPELPDVDAAIASGRWTAGDRARLLHDLEGLSRDDTDAVLSKIAIAVNDGRLRLDAPVM